MSANDIMGFLRTSYRPFAHCVPSNFPIGIKQGFYPHVESSTFLISCQANYMCAYISLFYVFIIGLLYCPIVRKW